MSLIKVKNASKIYGARESRVEALKNVNLEFEKEEFVAIVGHLVQEKQHYFT